jgi:hypothetical protein
MTALLFALVALGLSLAYNACQCRQLRNWRMRCGALSASLHTEQRRAEVLAETMDALRTEVRERRCRQMVDDVFGRDR